MNSAELIALSNSIVAKLNHGRASGLITEKTPMSGTEIAEAYNKKFETKYCYDCENKL